ncbi:MAG TPA: aminotransferase class V-fold PLP-dependent enzyme, partial [Planctomycetaceae bacterium]|nr:aminotransferase class V-fold PLP-dependent enzyme [Planctomycetaceae bacterium]
MTLYLDFNSTTPMDPRVHAEVSRCFTDAWGNPGSPHEFGRRAKELVHAARDRTAKVVAARRHDVIFTSGATESNNLALLGLESYARETGRRHFVSTQIEHKSVLEPLGVLQQRGFDVTLVPPERNGRVHLEAILAALRPDTLLVSMMHVNNETGVIQPVVDLAEQLQGHNVWLHVDAAQGFGKDILPLQHPRIDLLSITSHKIFGPPGVGALITRHRRDQTVPLSPLMHGGGQELGLRPGTLPTALIHGYGLAAELAERECAVRTAVCREMRQELLQALEPLQGTIHGDADHTLPHVLNVSFPGCDGDDVVEALEAIAAVATGSACTSVCATASHVLAAMKVQ